MSEITIQEGNLAIMLFDGWVKSSRQTFDPDHNTQNRGSNTYFVYTKNGRDVRPEDIEWDIVYHQSWNALMPIVQKINKWCDDKSDEHFESLLKSNFDPLRVLELRITEPIKNIWIAVIAFIQWYNTQTSIK